MSLLQGLSNKALQVESHAYVSASTSSTACPPPAPLTLDSPVFPCAVSGVQRILHALARAIRSARENFPLSVAKLLHVLQNQARAPLLSPLLPLCIPVRSRT